MQHSKTTPEIKRVPLEDLILQIDLLELGKPQEFLARAITPPKDAAIAAALNNLKDLSALEHSDASSSGSSGGGGCIVGASNHVPGIGPRGARIARGQHGRLCIFPTLPTLPVASILKPLLEVINFVMLRLVGTTLPEIFETTPCCMSVPQAPRGFAIVQTNNR
jgi:hypothetical protein